MGHRQRKRCSQCNSICNQRPDAHCRPTGRMSKPPLMFPESNNTDSEPNQPKNWILRSTELPYCYRYGRIFRTGIDLEGVGRPRVTTPRRISDQTNGAIAPALSHRPRCKLSLWFQFRRLTLLCPRISYIYVPDEPPSRSSIHSSAVRFLPLPPSSTYATSLLCLYMPTRAASRPYEILALSALS